MTDYSEIKGKIIKSGLKVTPQRIAVLDALERLNNHPSADQIIAYIKTNHPHIAAGTVYKTLLTFAEKGLIKKVTTEKDIMRFDGILERHHHIYDKNTDTIRDYFDEELNTLLESYFKNKAIPHFNIEEIKLQIIGNRNIKKSKP